MARSWRFSLACRIDEERSPHPRHPFRDGTAIAFPLGDAPAFSVMGNWILFEHLALEGDWQTDIDPPEGEGDERKAGRDEGQIRRFEVIPAGPPRLRTCWVGVQHAHQQTRQGTGRGMPSGAGTLGVVFKRSMRRGIPTRRLFGPGRMQTSPLRLDGETRSATGKRPSALIPVDH